MLEIEGLRVAFDHPVLEGIDLTVPTGRIVCILGPSGGGKSTLLRSVAGLIAYRGAIRVDGRDLAGVPAHRRDVGLMFQKDLLFPHLDVAGNVGYGMRRPDPGRVAGLLELVGLPGYGPRPVDTLSGGQAQRVALARALARTPRVLLLDEPFGALDVVLKAELVLDVQRLLREQGTTVLAVSHDRQEAFTLADEVAVLREGCIVQQGAPDDLWRTPLDGYVARLVGQSVLGGVAYTPEALAVRHDGPWEMVVTGRTFRDGHYLLTGVVGSEQIMLRCDSTMPRVGEQVRVGPV
jgi:thiamine transport system ATP-binding protein